VCEELKTLVDEVETSPRRFAPMTALLADADRRNQL
jgi:hypothetical protein